MKLFTLNTHSLVEAASAKEAQEKREKLASFLLRERPDVIALQEVNQPLDAACIETPERAWILDEPLREGNYLFDLARDLEEEGWPLFWAWSGFKRSWEHYCEGVALASPHRLISPSTVQLSETTAFTDWRQRKAIGARIQGFEGQRFYSVHFGWHDDELEPFAKQFERACTLQQEASLDTLWLMGDFNVDAHVRGEGYDLICNAGWYDSFSQAAKVVGDVTAAADIDGWQNRLSEEGCSREVLARRIDYIFSSKPIALSSHIVCLDGKRCDCVSDHFGVLVITS